MTGVQTCALPICHLQWYLDETAQTLVHGLSQAFMKRGLPRSLMTDNGSAMVAVEFVTGPARLGVVHQTTLPYSPYQNAKQESFWGRIEGRLMPMLEGEQTLTLDRLNEAGQAWRTFDNSTGIPPHAALRDRRHAAGSLSCRAHRDTPMPRLRDAVRRLPHRGQAPGTSIRWHLQPGRLPLRDPPGVTATSTTFTCATPAGT